MKNTCLVQVRTIETVKIVKLSETRIAEDMREDIDVHHELGHIVESRHAVANQSLHGWREVLSLEEAYEVPLIESDPGIFNRRKLYSNCATVPGHIQPRGWLDEKRNKPARTATTAPTLIPVAAATFTTIWLKATALAADEPT